MEAIAELDLALRLADLAGFAAFRGLALSNRGEALGRLGRFDEAVADLEAARDLYRRLGSRMVAYPPELPRHRAISKGSCPRSPGSRASSSVTPPPRPRD